MLQKICICWISIKKRKCEGEPIFQASQDTQEWRDRKKIIPTSTYYPQKLLDYLQLKKDNYRKLRLVKKNININQSQRIIRLIHLKENIVLNSKK